jgi:hypothetical protein
VEREPRQRGKRNPDLVLGLLLHRGSVLAAILWKMMRG